MESWTRSRSPTSRSNERACLYKQTEILPIEMVVKGRATAGEPHISKDGERQREGEGRDAAAVGGAGGSGVGADGGGQRVHVPALLARAQVGARLRPAAARHARRRQRRWRELRRRRRRALQQPPALARAARRRRVLLRRLRHALARRRRDRDRHAVLAGNSGLLPFWSS
jgi:hypothetical protein